jgi:hypothetical protein
MIRYFLAQGDRAGSAVITEGLPDTSCSSPPPRVQIATLYMKTYCTACKKAGFIAPKGPRWPGTASNGKQWALSGDINVCGCNPPPVFYAERGMKMTFTSEQIAQLMDERGQASSASSREGDADMDLEQYFEVVDARTGEPIEGMTYKLTSGDQSLVYEASLSRGRTQAYPVKDHPKLAFVAWRGGDVR